MTVADPAALLPVAEAQGRLLALARPVAAERVALGQAVGRWLDEPVVAMRTQPEHDLSAMDGYALRFSDLAAPIRVIGESAAGRPFPGTVAAGQAVRIFTGAVMPAGADTILIQEEAARNGDMLTLAGEGPPHVGAHVRPRGMDFAQGETLLPAGERMNAARVALAAMSGHGTLSVARRIRVAIAATGDELVPPGHPLQPGQTPETNGAMLAATLSDWPVEIVDLGILPDRLEALTTAFAGLEADILVTSGGASVGDHDLVRPALIAAGASLDFWRVAMRPGKPVMAGTLGTGIVLGLPGNPVSAFVTATLFLKPLIAALSGAAAPLPTTRRVTLDGTLGANGVRADYIRAASAAGAARPLTGQDSSLVRTLARADMLIVRPPHVPPAQTGDSVEILDLT